MWQIPRGKLGIFLFAAVAIISGRAFGFRIIESTFGALPGDIATRKRRRGQGRRRRLFNNVVSELLLKEYLLSSSIRGEHEES